MRFQNICFVCLAYFLLTLLAVTEAVGQDRPIVIEVVKRDTFPEFVWNDRGGLGSRKYIYQFDEEGRLAIENRWSRRSDESAFYVKTVSLNDSQEVVSTVEFFKVNDKTWRKVYYNQFEPIANLIVIEDEVVRRDTSIMFDYDTYDEEHHIFVSMKCVDFNEVLGKSSVGKDNQIDAYPEIVWGFINDHNSIIEIYQFDEEGIFFISNQWSHLSNESAFHFKIVKQNTSREVISTIKYFKVEDNIWRRVITNESESSSNLFRVEEDIVRMDTLKFFNYDTYEEDFRLENFMKCTEIVDDRK